MKELDFSEDASFERYVNLNSVDAQIDNRVMIDGLDSNDYIVYTLSKYGSLAAKSWIFGSESKVFKKRMQSTCADKSCMK